MEEVEHVTSLVALVTPGQELETGHGVQVKCWTLRWQVPGNNGIMLTLARYCNTETVARLIAVVTRIVCNSAIN